MRILHTADWHVGKRLRGRSRDQESAAALDQVVQVAADRAVDLVLIAGDVYEHRAVSPESDLLVFDALARLRDTGARVILIPGNHDSWQRLEALGKLLTPLGILAVPRVLRPTEGGVVEVPSRDGSEAALVACLPFVPERRFGDAASLFDDRASAYVDYDAGMGRVIGGLAEAFRPDRVNVLLGHLMVHGAKPGGGEQELTIGMTYAVAPARLPATATYAALGHVHRPQSAPAAPCPTRFAGSLLQLDFGEVEQDKSVVVVEAVAGKPPTVDVVPITAGRKLIDLEGSLDEVLARAGGTGDAFLRVKVHTDGPVPGLAERIRDAFPDAVWVEPVYERAEHERPDAGMSSLAPREQFVHYYRHAHGAEPEDALMDAFDRVYAEASEAAG